MRQRNWAFMVSVVLLMFFGTTTWAAGEQVFRLNWGHYLGSGPFLEKEVEFAKKIEERTNGRVKINIVYAGGLGGGSEVFHLAGRGAIDMASAPPGYYADHLHFWKAFQIPFVFDNSIQAIDVLMKSVEEFPAYREEMDKMNLIWLFQQPLGDYYLTGKTPVTSVEQLRGKKIRTFGMYIPHAHRAVGAVPVTVTAVEIYEALQRGVIDFSFLNLGNIPAYRLYEVGQYQTGPIMAITGHNIVIGKPTWDKFPKDIQEIFRDQARKTQQEYLPWLGRNDKESVRTIKEGGGVMVELPPEELAKWKALTPDLLGMWVDDLEKVGHGDMARRVAERWRELLK